MRFRFLLLVQIVSLTLAICHAANLYSATVVMSIQPRGIVNLGVMPSGTLTQQDAQNEFKVMVSSDVLTPVIADLHLDRTWARRLRKGDVLPMQDAMDYLETLVSFKTKPGTNEITVTVSSENMREAANIANAIADHYKTMRDSGRKQLDNEGLAVLRDQVTQQEKIVAAAKDAAKRNPQDYEAQRKADMDQSLLIALKQKLEQDEKDIRLYTSPVQIVSRATPPPE
jgi:capsular polysaccharide biosynthesis protein